MMINSNTKIPHNALKNYPELTKEKLYQIYIIEENSLPDIKAKYNISYSQTLKLLRYYNIKTRSISESKKLKKCKEKIIETFSKKYGPNITNCSQVKEVKEKKRQTFLKNYGVDNIWKSKNYYAWLDSFMIDNYGAKRINNPEKVSKANIEYWKNLEPEIKSQRINSFNDKRIKYQNSETVEQRLNINQKISQKVSIAYKNKSKDFKIEKAEALQISSKLYWENLTPEQKQLKIKSLLSGKYSKLELNFQNYLNVLKLDYVHSFYISRFQYDYKILNTNILIEIYGDYWHANPEKYKNNDIIHYPAKFIKAEDVWEKDKKKIELAKSNGYEVIVLWEKFLNSATENEILEKIYNEIKKCKENITFI